MNRVQLLLLPQNKGDASKEILTHPILDDIMIEATSEFSGYGDFAPTISTLTDLVTAYQGSGGSVGQGTFALRQILDMQRWTKTSPIKITLQVLFYTQTDAEKDVVKPINELWGLHLPRLTQGGKIKIPGMNATNMKYIDESFNLDKAAQEASAEEKQALKSIEASSDTVYNSIFSVIIPGIVYVPYAFLYSFRPTYSKQTTKRGFPLWAQGELQIQGISAAFHHDFTRGKNFYYSRLTQTVDEGALAELSRNLES